MCSKTEVSTAHIIALKELGNLNGGHATFYLDISITEAINYF